MTNAPKKILCIEHDREAAKLIAQELSARGFEVLLAYDGQEGLVTILKGNADLVVCDLGLPGMSGFEVLARLNELSPRVEHIPFVVLAARFDRNLELRVRRLGADEFVVKPIDFEMLHAIINAQLSGSALRQVAGAALKPLSGSALNGNMPRFIELNDREIETLTWAARGRTSSEIAKGLGLVKRTVDFHLDNARAKLGARTRIEAVAKAAARQLIKP